MHWRVAVFSLVEVKRFGFYYICTMRKITRLHCSWCFLHIHSCHHSYSFCPRCQPSTVVIAIFTAPTGAATSITANAWSDSATTVPTGNLEEGWHALPITCSCYPSFICSYATALATCSCSRGPITGTLPPPAFPNTSLRACISRAAVVAFLIQACFCFFILGTSSCHRKLLGPQVNQVPSSTNPWNCCHLASWLFLSYQPHGSPYTLIVSKWAGKKTKGEYSWTSKDVTS